MIVYQTDSKGYFVGPVNADPSPLEPGVWLIPGGCVTTAPPDIAEDEGARWTGDAWIIETIPEPEPDLPPPPPTLDDHRRAVDDHVEAVARARGYNNAATLASYVNSTVAAWAEEAGAFIPWRDAAWVHTFTRLEGVLQGAQEPPASPAALVAELPAPPWPLA